MKVRIPLALVVVTLLAATAEAEAQAALGQAEEETLRSEVNAFMTRYWRLFSTGRIDELVETVYHPSGQLGNQGHRSIAELRRSFPATREALLSGDYGRSDMPVRNICLLTPTLAIISGRGVRYLADGAVMGEYGWTYTLSKGPDGWRMLSILGHDPDTHVTCRR